MAKAYQQYSAQIPVKVNGHKNSTIECTLTFAITSQVSSFSEAMQVFQSVQRVASCSRKWSSTQCWRLLLKQADMFVPKVQQGSTTLQPLSGSSSAPSDQHPRRKYYRESPRREGKRDKRVWSAKMSKLVRRVGNFLLDQAAKQYERSMTRKLNAFGERREAVTTDTGSAAAAVAASRASVG